MRNTNRISLALFFLFFFSYAYFYPGGGHNEAARLDSIRAVLHDHTFIVDPYAYNSADLIKYKDHYYSSKAPGTLFLGLPFFWFFEKVFSLSALPVWVQDHWVCYWTSVCSIALPCALGMVVLFWLLFKMRRPEVKLREAQINAIIVTIAFGLGTIFFPFATLFFSHSATAAFLLVGFYQIFTYQLGSRDRAELWRLIIAGLALATAILFEFPAAIGAGFIGLYAIWKLRATPSRLVPLILAGVVGLLPLFIHNWIAFGSPFYISYEAYAQSSSQAFEAHKHGFLGIKLPFLDPNDWALFLHNLAEITYRPLRGIFVFNPILLFIFPGFFYIVRDLVKRKHPYAAEVSLALILCLIDFMFSAGFGDSIVYWGGGASFGPRHLLPSLPFFSLALLESLRSKTLRYAFVPVMAISIFFCLMATAIEPRTPYSPNNALVDYYLPKFMNSEYAITTVGVFTNKFMTPNSVAFNWAKVAGLPARIQLLPLFLIWLLAARELDTILQRAVKVKRYWFATGAIAFALIAMLIPLL